MLLVSSFFLVFFCLYAPVIITLQFHQQQTWQINIRIQYLFLHKNKDFSQESFGENKEKEEGFSLDIPIQKLVNISKDIWQYLQGKYFVKHCSINCSAGFSRPDFTAYSYGLLWAVIANLPPAWREWLTIDYQPNFQEKMLQIAAKGIIYIPFGYLILILMYSLKLLLKEWVNNENRLRGQLDGCSNGEYPTNG